MKQNTMSRKTASLSFARAVLFSAMLIGSSSLFSATIQKDTPVAHQVTANDINWRKFLSQHDMYWDKITTDYYSGAIMGNGLLGSNLYKLNDKTYRLDIGRTDVTEGRSTLPESQYKHGSHLYDEARLPIGYFTLAPKGDKIVSEEMRLSLYDAIARGTIKTNAGTIRFDTYVHSANDFVAFESEAEGGEQDYDWEFTPLKAISPRFVNNSSDKAEQTSYIAHPNPEAKRQNDGNYNLLIQILYSGKAYVVAWKQIRQNNKRLIIATVAQENTEAQAIASAKKMIDKGFGMKRHAREISHTAWWHKYYPASFVSFPHSKLESFYWAQIYKFACASRPGKPMADLQGPWAVQRTPWPCIWFNLNTQLTYSWQYTANRSELSEPLWEALFNNQEYLRRNVTDVPSQSAWTDAMALGRSASYNMYRPLSPELAEVNQYEVGNLTWLLFYYWEYCVYNNKQDELKTRFFDLLKQAVNYYVHIRFQENGVYHLPPTSSPEYGVSPRDCNYDLSVLHWGLKTLLNIDNQFSINDPLKQTWQDFLDNLAEYPADPARGFNLGEGKEFTSSHRHYSHLLMIYPLCQVNWEQPENRAIITRSVDNWQSLPEYLQGYSFTGSASMYAMMERPDDALSRLNSLLDKYIQKNTLYKESGPVFETPMSAVASLHELYLQSWGGKIRVFPAIPSTWQDASFINLRAEGAFLVSANLSKGKTVFIQVISEAGGKCRLQTGIDANSIRVRKIDNTAMPYTVISTGKGLIEVDTHPGDVFTVIPESGETSFPAAIPHPSEEAMPYGNRAGNAAK
jgi:hypothetical protein